jgi:hypothetical protein
MHVLRRLLAVLAIGICAAGDVSAAPGPVLTPTVVYVPEAYHTGGAYTAIQAAADGRVYLGTTVYDGFAHLLGFDPGSGRFESLAEMSAVTGERTPGPYAQAKIHTKPAIAPDGRVYIGTKSGKPAADARWQERYPGGHLLVHDPAARTTTDLGIVKPRVSIIAVNVDPVRGLVYVLTDPERRLVLYDPRSRTFTDRGQFGPSDAPPTRYLVVLANGDAFHQSGPSAVARYTAARGAIEQLPLVITGGGGYEPPYALAATADGRRFVGIGVRSGQAFLFEPREQTIGVRVLGALIPEGYSPPGHHYTVTIGPDGTAYYTGLFSRGRLQELFVLRVHPDDGQPRLVGRVAPLDPPPPGYTRTVARGLLIQGSTVTPDGTLIVMTAYPLRLLLFRRPGLQ